MLAPAGALTDTAVEERSSLEVRVEKSILNKSKRTRETTRVSENRRVPLRGAGLSSLVGTQIFWILFWVSSLGIPQGQEGSAEHGNRAADVPGRED